LFGAYRELPRNAKLLIYLSFMPWLAFSLIFTDLSFFLTKVQGFSEAFAGNIITTIGVANVAASIPVGILADRYGRRRFLLLGNLFASVTLSAFALTTQVGALYLAAVVEGVTEAMFATSSQAMLTSLAGDEHRTAAFSFWSALSNVAFGLSGFALPLVFVAQLAGFSSAYGHVLLFVGVAGLSAASTPLLLRIPESQKGEKAKTIREFLPTKSKWVLLRYGVTSVLIALGAGFFVPLMTLWFSLRYGVPDTVSGPLLGFGGFLIAAVSLVAPFLARRLGLVRAAALSQGLSMLFMVLVPLSPTFAVAGVIFTVRSFLMNVSNPMVQSLVMGLVTPDERGAAAGLSAAIWRFPNSISTSVGAVWMGEGLLALPFYLASVLYVISITLFWYFFRPVKLPEEQSMLVSS